MESGPSTVLPTLATGDVKKLSVPQKVSIIFMEKTVIPLKKEPSPSWVYDKTLFNSMLFCV